MSKLLLKKRVVNLPQERSNKYCLCGEILYSYHAKRPGFHLFWCPKCVKWRWGSGVKNSPPNTKQERPIITYATRTNRLLDDLTMKLQASIVSKIKIYNLSNSSQEFLNSLAGIKKENDNPSS